MRQSERRGTDRRKRRIPCHLCVGDREHNALVLDLSPTGLFIQTHARTQRGDRLKVRLSGSDGAALELMVQVVRSLHVPQSLLAAAKGGIGARITSAPPEYHQFVAALGLLDRADLVFEPEIGTPRQRYRVHLAQTGGPRMRRIELDASDPETASARALDELGGGWKVLRVEPI